MDSTLEPKLTLEAKVDFPELVLVPEPIILELKSTIPPSHILLLDQGIDHNDFEMIFQDWSYKGDNFHVRILHDPIQSRGSNTVNKKEVIEGGFFENPCYLDWAVTVIPRSQNTYLVAYSVSLSYFSDLLPVFDRFQSQMLFSNTLDFI